MHGALWILVLSLCLVSFESAAVDGSGGNQGGGSPATPDSNNDSTTGGGKSSGKGGPAGVNGSKPGGSSGTGTPSDVDGSKPNDGKNTGSNGDNKSSDSCNKESGLIKVKNEGAYAVRIDVFCEINGGHVTMRTKPFYVGQTRHLEIPGECRKIKINVRKYIFFWKTNHIFVDYEDFPSARCYVVTGVTFFSKHKQVDCSKLN